MGGPEHGRTLRGTPTDDRLWFVELHVPTRLRHDVVVDHSVIVVVVVVVMIVVIIIVIVVMIVVMVVVVVVVIVIVIMVVVIMIVVVPPSDGFGQNGHRLCFLLCLPFVSPGVRISLVTLRTPGE
ncbi:MAG: hypothetical protein PPP58_05775 [Natronomonas sp.]